MHVKGDNVLVVHFIRGSIPRPIDSSKTKYRSSKGEWAFTYVHCKEFKRLHSDIILTQKICTTEVKTCNKT